MVLVFLNGPTSNENSFCRINEEVRSMLTETPYAENLVDLIKLSSLSDEMQLDVCNLLITGECRSWASAFYKASVQELQTLHKTKVGLQLQRTVGISTINNEVQSCTRRSSQYLQPRKQ